MVLPIPFSSFKVGRMTLIFRLNHSRKNIYKRIKRVLKKNKKKIRESYLSQFRLRLSSMNATPIAAISVRSSNPGMAPALIVIVIVASS